ncbi:SAGA-associated factor 11 -like protein [Toxocara canis]|uniref:SAGA-associated factor 11 n=1 Tax=Toxocara canis TaxID=6265 RepID=A0A0B2UUQ3_TOXCA|nr:SAGA-associated factor 11 -like protein [Toxocara canis]
MSLQCDGPTASTSHDVEEIVESFFNFLLESVLLVPIFKIHRIAKIAKTIGPVASVPKEEPSSQLEEFDIFGNANVSQKPQKNMEVYCDECRRTIAASRFAPHLEKCMGMGRNSSRVARRRLANYVCSLKGSSSTGRLRDSVGRDSDMDRSDEDSRHTLPDDDDDWTNSRKSRKTRKAKIRSKPRPARSRLNVDKSTPLLAFDRQGLALKTRVGVEGCDPLRRSVLAVSRGRHRAT